MYMLRESSGEIHLAHHRSTSFSCSFSTDGLTSRPTSRVSGPPRRRPRVVCLEV
jgi:hypothetical protein